MFCSSALRKGLAQIGAFTLHGKPQPLPPPLPSSMQQIVDRMIAKNNGDYVDDDVENDADEYGNVNKPTGSVHSSRPGTPTSPTMIPPSLQVIPSMNLSFNDWDNSDGDSSVVPSSVNGDGSHSMNGEERLGDGYCRYEEGVHSILPTLVDGDSWFYNEEVALNKLRGVVPMVHEWCSKIHEDGFPVPTIVEELVEKNGLAAALNHGWWQFVGEFIYLTATIPRWRTVVAMQLQGTYVFSCIKLLFYF